MPRTRPTSAYAQAGPPVPAIIAPHRCAKSAAVGPDDVVNRVFASARVVDSFRVGLRLGLMKRSKSIPYLSGRPRSLRDSRHTAGRRARSAAVEPARDVTAMRKRAKPVRLSDDRCSVELRVDSLVDGDSACARPARPWRRKGRVGTSPLSWVSGGETARCESRAWLRRQRSAMTLGLGHAAWKSLERRAKSSGVAVRQRRGQTLGSVEPSRSCADSPHSWSHALRA